MRGSQLTHTLLNAPMRTLPFCIPLISATCCMVFSWLFNTISTAGSSEAPLPVSFTPLLVRANSENPNSSSMPATAWLMAEGVTCSSSAARAKLPCCATA